MEYLSPAVYTAILILAIIYIIVIMIKNFKKDIDFKENIKKCVPYMIIFCFPLVWYVVLKQHSYTHVNFTYRLLAISVIAILIIVSKILKEKTYSKQEEKQIIEENKGRK